MQNLGAVISYLRRYLWVNAFEIVEHDALDATTGKDEPAKPVAKKPEPLVIQTDPKTKEEFPSEGWQIIMPECSDEDWLDSLKTCSGMLLQMAEKIDDVQNIFKVNRSLFDKAKTMDKEFYDNQILPLFSKTKANLTKE